MNEALESDTVFIDTCIFRNSNFWLDNDTFSEFKRLCQEGQLKLVTTEITKFEIRRRIEEQAKEAFAALEKFKNKTHLLPKMHRQFGEGYKALTVLELQRGMEKAVDAFFRQTKARVLPIPDGAVKRVFGKYFKNKKPFSEGEKKSEFPDAFVIEALSALRKKVYVVSSDEDFKGADKNLIRIKQLGQLLDIFNSHKTGTAEFVKKVVSRHQGEIMNWAQEELRKIPIKFWDETAEIRWAQVTVLQLANAWVVSLKKNVAHVSVDLIYQLSGTAFLGDETVGYIYAPKEFAEEQAVSGQLKVVFNRKNESTFKFYGKRLDVGEQLTVSLWDKH